MCEVFFASVAFDSDKDVQYGEELGRLEGDRRALSGILKIFLQVFDKIGIETDLIKPT